MKILDTIFRSTYKFWAITRVILILLFASTATYYATEEVDLPSMIVGIFILAFVLSLLYVVIRRLTKKETAGFLHIYNGIFAIIFSLGVLYASFVYFDLSTVWYVLYLPVWLILYGLWEITYERNGRHNLQE